MGGSSRPFARPAVAGIVWACVVLASLTPPALGVDPENCLSCHRFRGLSRIHPDSGELRLFFCSAEYYVEQQGPHAQLRCTACHPADEVSTVPHQVKTPVDCTTQCHVVPLAGVEIPFSHAGVLDHLARSAHSPENLADLPFEPPLLRPGQSSCLYCHDQPVFRAAKGRFAGLRWTGDNSRCDTCHGEELPIQVAYHIRHVTSRLQSARPVKQLAQVCAVCHSDSRFIEKTGGHDAVASYFHSFHGKASLLGSTETANCVDCHSSEAGDVHAMLGREAPLSSVSTARLPTTCRTTDCHPGAPPGMSQAAVHLELDPRARTPEFYVAAMFVALTAGVMSVFFLYIILELLNLAIRRSDPEHRRLIRLARKLQASPEGRKLLERMDPHQRVQHWMLAITFIVLAVTGMPIKFADAGWASGIITSLHGLPIARLLHRICGALLIAAFFYHLTYLLVRFTGKVRQARRAGNRESILRMLLSTPMMLTPADAKEFLGVFAYLLGLRRHRPPAGHFNFTQKFEYWAVFWGIPIMGLSGLALWSAAGISEYVSGRMLNFAFIIHSDEAYLAFIYIAVVHIFSIILMPTVFPLSTATLSGQAPAAELAETHRRVLEEAASRLGITVEDEPGRRLLPRLVRQLVRRTYSAGMAVACAAIGFISMRFLFTLLFGHQSAPVEIVDIPRRLDATMLTVAAPAAPMQRESRQDIAPRGPLAHFHLIPAWFQPDVGNDCTTSGCHAPLPHGRRIEVRAFLNMHGTFLDCTVCHAMEADQARRAQWFSLADREACLPPAVLRLTTALDAPIDSIRENPRETTERLQALLRQALAEAGENVYLRDWLVRLETTYPGSDLWLAIVDEMRSGIVMHTHGEYGAKIGLYNENRLVGALTGSQKDATRRYLAGKENLPPLESKKLLDMIHEKITPIGVMCTPCHSEQPTLMDFTALGYTDERAREMRGSLIVSHVLSIERGEPFHLPLVTETRSAP